MFVLEIDNGSGFVDYTQYVLPESISVQDSINVPTLLSFTLVNTNDAFIPPLRSAYCRLYSGKFGGMPLATGFVTSAPSVKYLGLANNVPSFNFQRYSYDIQVSSDEWLLNVKTVPYLPPFVNLGQGQLLAKLAEILVPNFFDTTSFAASGDLVPFFAYDPTQNWSDLAKQFADGSRYRYKVLDRIFYFQPYGDGPLGVTYDETAGEATFYPNLLQTPVVPVPPVNDAIVIGNIEAQNNHDDYFVGDGITGNFNLRHQVFEGASSVLLQESWSSDTINTSVWTVQDPTDVISEAGGGLQVGLGAGDGGDGLGNTYVLANSGIELGGAVNVQVGDFQFVDVCDGIVGGLYRDSTLSQSSCIAGFQLGSSGTVVPTASGAIGVTMQPLLNGQAIGPKVVSQQNHSYFLQLYLSAQNYSRYDRVYRTLTGAVFGDVRYSSAGTINFIIADTSVDDPNNPTITLFSATGITLPEFALFAVINANDLNLALSNTLIGLPPQGGLWVRSLYGPTANQFPVFPPGPQLQYLLGQGFQNQVATIGQANDAQQLQFYASSYQTLQGATLPAVGARIRLQTWESGAAMARMQDQVSIAAEAKIVGDDGHRTAVMRTLNPLPRTSSECEAAGVAAIADRNTTQYEGQYEFLDFFFKPGNFGVDAVASIASFAPDEIGPFLPMNVTYSPGSLLIALQRVRAGLGGPITISDSAVNNWHSAYNVTNGNEEIGIWYANGVPFPGTDVIQFSNTGNIGPAIYEWVSIVIEVGAQFKTVSGVTVSPGTCAVSITGGISMPSRGIIFAFINACTTFIDQSVVSPEDWEIISIGFDDSGRAQRSVVVCMKPVSQPGFYPITVENGVGYASVTMIGVVPSATGGLTSSYPIPGRYLDVTAPQRGISGLQLLVRRVTTRIIELAGETMDFVVDYGPDYFLDKLLNKFVEHRESILTPKDTAAPILPQQLEELGSFYLDTLNAAQVTGFITGFDFTVDLGVVPATGVEVRKTDFGWTKPTKDLIKTVTTRTFKLTRSANEEIYYLRMVNGSRYSRFSKVIRVVYPLPPSPPPNLLIDYSVPAAPVITVNLPLNVDRNIYGVQIDSGGMVINPPSAVFLISDDPHDNRQFQVQGFDASGNTLADSGNLNGETEVSTVNTTYALVTSVRILN